MIKIVWNIHLLECRNAACLLSYWMLMWHCGMLSIVFPKPFFKIWPLSENVTSSDASAKPFSIEVIFINRVTAQYTSWLVILYIEFKRFSTSSSLPPQKIYKKLVIHLCSTEMPGVTERCVCFCVSDIVESNIQFAIRHFEVAYYARDTVKLLFDMSHITEVFL